MSALRIIRQISPLGFAGYACTVMAVREDSAGKNEFGVRLRSTLAEAERAADALEGEIRARIVARGDSIAETARVWTRVDGPLRRLKR